MELLRNVECQLYNFETRKYDRFEKGYFHQWGLEDSGDCENGYNISVGIVELENGQVITINPSYISFID